MPVDLSDYPALAKLVEIHSEYRKAWMEGRFPPAVDIKRIAKKNAERAAGKSGKPAAKGPGTEATLLLSSLGIAPLGGCTCKAFARQMDRWGVVGCREHMEEILTHFRKYQAQYGWLAKFKAASLAAVTGLAFKLNWLDPLPDLIAEAIRRAEVKEQAA